LACAAQHDTAPVKVTLTETESNVTTLSQFSARQVVVGFAAGALSMALLTLVGAALAQTPTTFPTPLPPMDVQQMVEWCRQMMSQGGAMMQGMMSGMCMGR
jgi:hypothetical protein